MNAGFFFVGHDFHPVVCAGQDGFDFGDGQVFFQFQGDGLTVAAHCADAHAQAVDHGGVVAAAEDFVGFRAAFPFFFRLAVAQIRVNPRNQAAGKRHAEVGFGIVFAAQKIGNFAVDVENRAGGVGQLFGHLAVDRAHAADEFAHVFRARTGCGLVSHAGRPFDQVVLEQAAECHQHQRNGAVAADVVFHAVFEAVVDHVAVDGVEHDDRVVFHAQCGGRVDPVAVPAGIAQGLEHGFGVVAALAGYDDVHFRQFGDVVCVKQRSGYLTEIGGCAADVGCGEEIRFGDAGEVVFFAHTLHQHRTDHAAPADKSYFHVCLRVFVC